MNPPTNNADELDRILRSLTVIFPRTTSADTTDTNLLAWALIDTIRALKEYIATLFAIEKEQTK